jgi:hypothetical protein
MEAQFTREDIRQDTEETIRRVMPEIVRMVIVETVPPMIEARLARFRVELLAEMQRMVDASVDDVTDVIRDALQIVGEELNDHDGRIYRLERKVL